MGLPYLILAFIARLPFAMTVVGTLTTLVARGYSIAEAGLVSALVGIGTAAAAPLLGRGVERFGQRRVLLVVAVGFAAALFGFIVLAAYDAPVSLLIVVALVLGVMSPQVAPMSRTRVSVAARAHKSQALVDRSMGYESIADEGSFVIGPVLVGILAVAFGDLAPLLFAVAITVTAIVAFALHPTARPVSRAVDRSSGGSVRLVTRHFVLLVSGMAAVGGVFGATLTSLTGRLESDGIAEWTGLIYGVMSVGSIVSAAFVTRIPSKVLPRRWRWCGGAILTAAALLLLALPWPIIGTVFSLAVLGLGVGASLATIFSYTTDVIPQERQASAFAILTSALVVGQALITAATGQVVGVGGYSAGYVVACVVGVLLLLVALAERFDARRDVTSGVSPSSGSSQRRH